MIRTITTLEHLNDKDVKEEILVGIEYKCLICTANNNYTLKKSYHHVKLKKEWLSNQYFCLNNILHFFFTELLLLLKFCLNTGKLTLKFGKWKKIATKKYDFAITLLFFGLPFKKSDNKTKHRLIDWQFDSVITH